MFSFRFHRYRFANTKTSSHEANTEITQALKADEQLSEDEEDLQTVQEAAKEGLGRVFGCEIAEAQWIP